VRIESLGAEALAQMRAEDEGRPDPPQPPEQPPPPPPQPLFIPPFEEEGSSFVGPPEPEAEPDGQEAAL
jgi:hypothetical protein